MPKEYRRRLNAKQRTKIIGQKQMPASTSDAGTKQSESRTIESGAQQKHCEGEDVERWIRSRCARSRRGASGTLAP
jgi:hypothetical protein